MAAPLPESVASALKDPTSALAALMVIANAHRDLFAWAARMIRFDVPAPPDRPAHPRPKARRAKANGARRGDADEDLLEAMRASPGATIGALAGASGSAAGQDLR
jgi:hypothetical protein